MSAPTDEVAARVAVALEPLRRGVHAAARRHPEGSEHRRALVAIAATITTCEIALAEAITVAELALELEPEPELEPAGTI